MLGLGLYRAWGSNLLPIGLISFSSSMMTRKAGDPQFSFAPSWPDRPWTGLPSFLFVFGRPCPTASSRPPLVLRQESVDLLKGNLLQGFLKGIYKGSILCTVAAAARVLVELIAGRPFDRFDTCKHLVDKPCGYNAATRP